MDPTPIALFTVPILVIIVFALIFRIRYLRRRYVKRKPPLFENPDAAEIADIARGLNAMDARLHHMDQRLCRLERYAKEFID